MSRSLASVQEITEVRPIEGKDKIVLATVLGWQVIVTKEDFKVGTKCIYVEIDSVLPEKPEFEFLRNKNFRIKTMKMAGAISEGICFPMSLIPNGEKYKVGDDVTDIIGVTQYEPEMDNDREVKVADTKKYPKFLMRFRWFRNIVCKNKRQNKGFPNFISKTDENRVQEIPRVLESKEKYVLTEKVDGQSGTFALVKHKGRFGKCKYEYIVCSRNLRLWKKGNQSYWFVSDKYNIENVLKNIIGDNEWVAIQGECIAPNVQGNKYNVTEPDLYVFNLIYPNGRVGSLEAKNIMEKNGVKFVPIVSESAELPDTVEEMLNLAHGNSALNPKSLREGLVCRTIDGKHSFKAVDPLFLIKYQK